MIRKRNFKLNWKYALGELVLIFLGISLAITFQNFNETQRGDQLKYDYYDRLLLDLERDNNDLNELIGRVNQHLKLYETADSIVALNRSKPEKHEMLIDLLQDMLFFEFFANTDTYDDLVASGNLKVLDGEIRSELVNLANHHIEMKRYEEGNNNWAVDLITRLSSEQPMVPPNDVWKDFVTFNSEQSRTLYYNYLRTRRGSDGRAKERYQQLMSMNNQLIQKIQSNQR